MNDPSTPDFLDDPEFARFADDLREAFTVAPRADVRATHLAAMGAQQIVDVAPRKSRLPRPVVRGAVVAAGLVLVGGSALAGTGNMPGPVQDAVADVLFSAGVDLPGGSDDKANAKGGNPKNVIAAANKARAEAFTSAKKAWLECVKAARPAEGTDEAATFDPEAACGPKPSPKDFGVADKPEKTAKPEKTDRPEKTPKAERTEKPAKTDRPEGTDKVVKTPKPERTSKATTPGNARTPKPDRGGRPTPDLAS